MHNFRNYFRRKPYVPPPVPLAWVPNVEYYVIIIPATLAFLVAYIHFVGILSLHFYGIFDRDLHDKLYGSGKQEKPPEKPLQKPPEESTRQPGETPAAPSEGQAPEGQAPEEQAPPTEPPQEPPEEPPQEPPEEQPKEPPEEPPQEPPQEPPEERAHKPGEEPEEEAMEFFDIPADDDKPNEPEEPEESPSASKQHIEFRAYHTNLHPLVNALVPFFIANGILIFRVACCYNRTVLKVLHTVLLVLPIPQVLMSVPYIMMWSKFVDRPLKDQHFWSLHCWMGLLFILLFFVTLISGIYVYFYMPKKAPFESCEFRAKFTPYHSFMGTVLFIISVLQVITGLTSTAQLLTWDTWKANDDSHTKRFGSRMFSLKVSALLYALSGMTVIYALYRDDFRYRGRIILTADPRDIN